MAILNYTTSIAAEKTANEIQAMLVRAKAKTVVFDYEPNGTIAKLSFQVETIHGPIIVRLPANIDGVLKAIQHEPKVPKNAKTREQASRVAWRILKDWVAAQLAIIEAELATLPQVFLPYVQTDNGQTLYERFEAQGLPMLTYSGGSNAA